MVAHRSQDSPDAGTDPDVTQVVTTTRGVWLLLGSIAGAKLGTVLVIVAASRSAEVLPLVTATIWYWLPVAGALLAGPILFRLRLRRVRAKRDRLRRAEWMLPDGPDPAPPAIASPPG